MISSYKPIPKTSYLLPIISVSQSLIFQIAMEIYSCNSQFNFKLISSYKPISKTSYLLSLMFQIAM